MSQARTPVMTVAIPWSAPLLLVLPLAGLALLLARPEVDIEWQHHPSHFWLVLGTAAVSVALAYLTNVVAGRNRDARVVLISLTFLSAAGFLGLHALSTPGVLLDASSVGFVIATPVGLFIASILGALSVTSIAGPRAMTILRRRSLLLAMLVGLMATWAAVSLARLPPLNGPLPPAEAVGPLVSLAVVAVTLYAIAAWRYLELYRRRGAIVLAAIAVALVLLAEATLAVALSRNWHVSWWEWHVLMLVAFLTIALGTRREYRRSGSLTSAFGGLYLEATLARIDRWHASAIASVAGAADRGEPGQRILDDLRREGASADEVRLVVEAAGELRRLDALFRPYLPSSLAARLRHDPGVTRLGGVEREVSVVFADLAGFTAFSETHAPTEVIAMLNAFWAVIVPTIDRFGGAVEHFAGDAVMATFNTGPEQPDHAARAAGAALAIVAEGMRVAEPKPSWPIFRAGVSTGPAAVGNVGAEGRRSFGVIGDTTNLAARLQAVAEPGQVVVSAPTWVALGPKRVGSPLGPTRVKGKREPVEAWLLSGFSPPTASAPA